MLEFEAHFLNIDQDEMEKKLIAIGAKKVSDSLLRETIFDTKDRTWNVVHKRVRIRTDGAESEVCYKEQIKANAMGGTEEIETHVSDPQKTKMILEKLGLIAVREQEKRRITYKFNDVVFDIDIWPRIPAYIEIESDSEEKVRAASEKLGFKWQDACFFDAKKIIIDIYGIKDFDNVKIFIFDKLEYHEQK